MKALVTGITGQTGSYLAEILLSKNYNVAGLIRRSSSYNINRIKDIINDITLFSGDLCDQTSINDIIMKFQPDEVYNLAAQSFVPTSWNQPAYTADTNGMGVLRVLDAIKAYKPSARFLQSSTSEMFGKVQEIPQKETTPFHPRSPYGVAKVYGYWITVNYRESYEMYTCNSICFNMESPRRGSEFVTKKIAEGVAEIYKGRQTELRLGNLDSKRDWGHARDYANAMYLMLQQEKPDDYIIGSEETHSIREFCNVAFRHAGLNYEDFVIIDQKFFRPAEVDLLLSDCTKARTKLGWVRTTCFEDLVKEMVEAELEKE
jgi:GDPmannose 4,6-dehydratase